MAVNIALDGPSGSGKSTMAKRISKELGYFYIDTGALYRALGLFILRAGADPDNENAVSAMIEDADISFGFTNGTQHTFIDEEDVSEKIRTPEVSDYASRSSTLRCVREKLLSLQRDFAAEHDLIMDGRDIGTTVLPNAQIKIYLSASAEDRARRRYEEFIQRGLNTDFSTVLADIIERDKRDMTREISPLRKAEDAVSIDTTGLTLEEGYIKVCGKIMALLKELK